MSQLPYDPGAGTAFWEAVSKLPGYPADELMPIREMLFESDALFKTSAVLKRVGARLDAPLVVVMDETRMLRRGQDLKELALRTLQNEGWEIRIARMRPDASGQVHTDMPHIREVQAALTRGCSVLSIGSGVVTDIAKHGCFLFQQEGGERVPYVVFQTANSVSAYTSNMSPTFVEGVKRTLDSRYPDALICDLETLRDAPPEMTAGGVGDMLAVFTSLPDWYLAHALGMDPVHTEMPKRLVGPLDELLLSHAAGIRTGELASVAMLAKIIALGGLAMSLSHVTTPMSGIEHVISHMLDLQAEIRHAPLTVHGSQVALATLAGSEMYRHFLDGFDPHSVDLEQCYPTAEVMERRVLDAFQAIDPSGAAGAECWGDYRQKLENWHAHRPEFEAALRDWQAIKSCLEADIRPVQALLHILSAVGAPRCWSELDPPVNEPEARFAFMNAPLMRKRMTLGDLLFFTAWDRESLWQQIWLKYA